jgi:glycosyltransferase involved in cell wall biosynthesis
MRILRSVAAHILLVGTYGCTWLIATLGRAIPRRPWQPTGRIMVTGTICNPNWYLSHITPLIRSGVKEVILVIDEPQQPLAGVRFACPPKWLARLASRAGAKAIWMIAAGVRYGPDLFMGYNLVAGGCTALVAGTLLRRPACYQMTGGQVVLSTVDFTIFDFKKAGRFRQKASKAIERLAVSVIRRFDLVVVRGSKAKAFLAGYGIEENVAVITGSVRSRAELPRERSIDLVFIGRLEPVKQTNQFIEVVQAVSRVIPAVKATIVGDGSLMEEMKTYAARLGVTNNLEFLGRREDVEQILASSRIFVLTSKSEGLSIAMAEAMANGAVPVVANVGELADLVADGVSGFLITPDRVAEYVEKLLPLLTDDSLWAGYSRAARETAREHCDIEVITKKWSRSLGDVVARTSGRDLSYA